LAYLVYFSCIMSYKTLTVRTEAYERLQKLKAPGESFSEVILRELPEPWETCGDVLEGIRKMQIPKPDRKLMEAVLKGRGRRSQRK
jgi:predicted CopG family antitoxin